MIREPYRPTFISEIKGLPEKTRVRIVAYVIDKYISPKKEYGYVEVIDETGEKIRVKFFGDDVKKLEELNHGDIIEVFGTVREWKDEVYVSPKFVFKRNELYNWYFLLLNYYLRKIKGLYKREEKPLTEIEKKIEEKKAEEIKKEETIERREIMEKEEITEKEEVKEEKREERKTELFEKKKEEKFEIKPATEVIEKEEEEEKGILGVQQVPVEEIEVNNFDLEKKVYKYIEEHPECSIDDIARDLKLDKKTVEEILKELLAKGDVYEPYPGRYAVV